MNQRRIYSMFEVFVLEVSTLHKHTSCFIGHLHEGNITNQGNIERSSTFIRLSVPIYQDVFNQKTSLGDTCSDIAACLIEIGLKKYHNIPGRLPMLATRYLGANGQPANVFMTIILDDNSVFVIRGI